MAFVIAIGVKATGEREVLGFDLGTREDGSFWLAFLRNLVATIRLNTLFAMEKPSILSWFVIRMGMD
jgi:hypothetical protein